MALDRLARVVTPLGDALKLHSMSGREELSRPFAYDLVLLSDDPALKASDLLGQSAGVELELADDQVRHFHGVVTRFTRGAGAGRHAVYSATLRPWLWLLSRTSDCRIFQHMTVPDVIKQVFRDFGLTDFDDALSGSYRSWDYLVQYRESALNFVSRLMEQEGIYYFFKHEAGKHTLVLADGYGAHATQPGYDEVPYYPPDQQEARERDHLSHWSASEHIQSGAYVVNDFDFTRPKASLQAKSANPRDHAKADLEQYDYPGEYEQAADGESYAKIRLQSLLAEYEQLDGQGNARGLAAGSLFELSGFPVDDQNREYLVIATHYSIQNNTHESARGERPEVRAELSAIESRTQYRPAQLTPKPTISGPQTAIVVGKSGEEIWTDPHGRVKVQFHWDRVGKRDENSSCWVRVAQLWAGGSWGGIHIPRIGQEVIIEFLEGDPDRPIITGRVYNGDNKPPYGLPANQTQSGIKSRSTKSGNPDNFNELRFEDKKGEEQVYLQAEKDYQIYVKHDESRRIDNDRLKDVGHNETVKVGVDRTESVGSNETITIGKNRTEDVGANEKITIGGDRSETVARSESIAIGTTRSETVGAAESVSVAAARVHTIGGADALNVGGAHTVTVGGLEAITVGAVRTIAVGANQSVDVGGNHSMSIGRNDNLSVGGNLVVQIAKDDQLSVGGKRSQTIGKDDELSVGKTLAITATDQIVLKSGDASITLKKNGEIIVSGKNITLKGTGKINIKADGDAIIKGSKVAQN
jgi:type VI secretion system secreted protein VgrG